MTDVAAVPGQGRGGFTLLEVLVALAILAISLGALLPVFSATLERQTAMADQKMAGLLAQSRIDAIGAEGPLADGISDGQFANGFTWHVEIAPYSFDRASKILTPKLVTLTVRWPTKHGPRGLVLTTVRAGGP